ncbi:MAG: substrate-binding domain-containing protein [Oscillospiraceae bacterium]
MAFNKKFLAIVLACVMALSLVACGTTASTPAASGSTPATGSTATGDKPYIAIVSKGFQHQFWQVVKVGAEQAAIDYDVEITFDGPPSETDVAVQVDMLKSAIDKKPDAIALAALDTQSVMELLNQCVEQGIPVIGFDSGVPNAPEGAIFATASTDNAAAAGIAAEHLYANEDFKAALDAATGASPVYVGVLSQDATSESVVNRTAGFIDKLVELVGEENVEVKGHDKYNKAASGEAKLVINVNVPPTTAADAMKTGAETLLGAGNLSAIYGSNENAAGGILAASNDGQEFAEGGKYNGIIAIGFDAGKTQRTAVENGWFYGSITQDPFQIGYKAVELSVQAIKGETAASEIVDTGAKWYDSSNLNDADITDLVYE